MKVLIILAAVVTAVVARSAIRRPHDEDYMPDDTGNRADYDHESFLGSDKEEFDNLSSDDAKRKLWQILPRLDENEDKMISTDEIYDWIKKQLLVYIVEDAKQLHEGNDVNKDGFISWKEFVATTYGLGFVDNEQKTPSDGDFDYRQLILRDYNKFLTADTNGDQFLSVDEMGAFVHPEEFHHTRHLAVEESMADLDRNKDGKVSLEEYISDILADEEEEANNPEWLEGEKDHFNTHRDSDKDGFLDIDELKAWLTPNNDSPAQAEAEHLIKSADVDNDGQLSFEEILSNHGVFVGMRDFLTAHSTEL